MGEIVLIIAVYAAEQFDFHFLLSFCVLLTLIK